MAILDSAVETFFTSSPSRVFGAGELYAIHAAHRDEWLLPPTMSSRKFIKYLLEHNWIHEVTLKSKYGVIVRFASGATPSPFSAALAIRPSGYLCHGTAISIHGLGHELQEVFVNFEQSSKPPNDNDLQQAAIDKAFRRTQRRSSLVYAFEGRNIVVISGKQSSNLGVVQLPLKEGLHVKVTGLERTLIDATVRPDYAGGVQAVLNAFREARGQISVENLVSILSDLEYTYPYHQSIGFYLDRAGYADKQLHLFARVGILFDFYLSYGMKDAVFDDKWRIHYPKGLR